MTFQMVWPEETFITAFKFTLVWPLQGKEKSLNNYMYVIGQK